MNTAVQDFLQMKHAAVRQEKVKAHTREGKQVKAYTRVGESNMTERQLQDVELWRAWNKGGRKPEDMEPLLKRFEGLIQSRAMVYKGKVRIPPSAIDLEFKRHFVSALENYDPKKGSLGTYVGWYLNKAKRFITNHQNLARIPENRTYKIREFQTAEQFLDEDLGRPPTHDELAKFMGWKPKEVARMSTELRKDLPTSKFEEDPSQMDPSRVEEVLRLIQYELTPEELQVFRHTFGVSGAEKMSPGQIAGKLNMTPSKVSRIRKRISTKVETYLE